MIFNNTLPLYSGDVRWMVSAGCDRYVEVRSRSRLPPLAFVVQKDRISKDITIEMTSPSLKLSIQDAILSHLKAQTSPKIDMDVIFMHYDALKSHYRHLEEHFPHDEATEEMRLLVSDLLPERVLYEGIGFEAFRRRGIICPGLIQDIHYKSICAGLDEIEDCFRLGIVPDHVNERYLEEFNAKFTDLARTGDYLSLQDLSEPAVRSGEIEFQYNPALLLELLDNGHLETYLYILDLIDRTRPCLMVTWDPNFSDITFEPMYVAIRLGHLDIVQSFINSNSYFEGRVYDNDQPVNGHVFTPLFAAVFWGQKDIVGLLLRSGPIYLPGYHQAAALALAGDMQDMIQLLIEHKTLASQASLLNSYPSSWIASQGQPAPIYLGSSTTPGAPHELGRSMSGITSGLSNSTLPGPPERLSSSMPPNTMHSAPSNLSTYPSVPPVLLPNSEHHKRQVAWNSRSSHEQDRPQISAKEMESHKARREQSQKLVARLEHKLQKVSEFCRTRPSQDFADLSGPKFDSAEQVWISGVHGFREIVSNRTPSSLVEAMQCLLLADALICHLTSQPQRLQAQ